MNELAEKIANSTDRIGLIPHRGLIIMHYRNLGLLVFHKNYPKNGAAWVDFHRAAKSLGLTRTWTDQNLNTWEV